MNIYTMDIDIWCPNKIDLNKRIVELVDAKNILYFTVSKAARGYQITGKRIGKSS